jgi:hypothetical protein
MRPRHALVATAFLLGLASPSWADAIDGHWCDAGTKHLEINGPSIVTPSGAALTGDYSRHGFKYQEPANGTVITMLLLNEVTMRLKAGDAPEETWHRCAAPTSQRLNNQSGAGNG